MGNYAGRFRGNHGASQRAHDSTANSSPRTMIPIPQRRSDQQEVPIGSEDHELDKQTLEHALMLMAEYIHRKGQDLTIITLGGATNTLLLQNRPSTHDIDFLGANLNDDQCRLLGRAARYAERRSPTPLGREWFNNAWILWIPVEVHRRITREAIDQDEIVFQGRGLKVVAAPWKFAFCCKMNRLARNTQGGRTQDLSDAVSYLHRHIQRRGGRPVLAGTIIEWA